MTEMNKDEARKVVSDYLKWARTLGFEEQQAATWVMIFNDEAESYKALRILLND